MTGWSDPQKGGRAVGAALYPTLSSLLSTAPQPGTRATASDAPGSMLFEVGGKWGGDLGRIATSPALDALPSANMGSVCAWLYNSLTPLGWTQMCRAGGVFVPVPGQILYRAKGTLLDRTAEGLTVAAWTEVWQSDALPSWMIAADPTISVSSEAEMADTVSTAICKIRLRLDGVPSSSSDENSAFIGAAGAAVPFGRGFAGIRYRGNIVGTTLYATAGSLPYSTAAQPHRTIAWLSGGTLRLRIDAWPGATTNTIKVFSVDLWSGS